MTGKDILEALSFVDEGYIEEAQTGKIRAALPAKRLLPLAACLALVLAGLRLWGGQAADEEMENLEDKQVHQEVILEFDRAENVMQSNHDMVLDEAEAPQISREITSVLRIEAWSEDGFTATVLRNEDGGTAEPGTEVQVRFTYGICVETVQDGLITVERRRPDEPEFPAGTLVGVRYQAYNEETGVMQIESIAFAPDEKG